MKTILVLFPEGNICMEIGDWATSVLREGLKGHSVPNPSPMTDTRTGKVVPGEQLKITESCRVEVNDYTTKFFQPGLVVIFPPVDSSLH